MSLITIQSIELNNDLTLNIIQPYQTKTGKTPMTLYVQKWTKNLETIRKFRFPSSRVLRNNNTP